MICYASNCFYIFEISGHLLDLILFSCFVSRLFLELFMLCVSSFVDLTFCS
jgi:hypothetical protein